MDNQNIPKVLFITRKYPPSKGGMEFFMQGLISNYPGPKVSIVYGGSQKWLPFVYVWQFIKASWTLFFDKEISIVHAGDGVMSPMVWLLNKIFNRKSTLTTYGKDVNLKSSIYQATIPFFMKRMDYYFPISERTKAETVSYGICTDFNSMIVTPGVDINDFDLIENVEDKRDSLLERYGIDLKGRKILLTVGRLSERKGVRWFTNNVIDKIKDDFVYLSIGADSTEINGVLSMLGIEKISYKESLLKDIKEKNLEDTVYLLGKMPFADMKVFYSLADVFLMPNVTVPGDMEGFGIVNIEAGLMGTPVVASDIEGISDAVINGVSGSLVEEKNVEQYLREIRKWVGKDIDANELRKTVIERYSWETLSRRYFEKFVELKEQWGKRNLVYLFPFFSGPYGAERDIYDNIKELEPVYNQTFYTLGSDPADIPEFIANLNIRIHYFKAFQWLKSHKVRNFLSPFVLFLYSFKILFSKHADIYILVNWQSLFAAPILKLTGSPVVYKGNEPPRFAHDLKDETLQGLNPIIKIFMELYIFVIKTWESLSYKIVTEIITNSDWSQSQLKEIGNVDSVVITPSIEVHRFDGLDKDSARERLGIDKNASIYLTVSKAHPRKKIIESIDLYIEQKKPNSNYYIIGGGPQLDELMDYAKSKNDRSIRVLGRVDEDAVVTDYYVASDYFIFTAKDEPFGIAPLEAKVAGCEILGIDNNREILTTKQVADQHITLYDKLFGDVRQQDTLAGVIKSIALAFVFASLGYLATTFILLKTESEYLTDLSLVRYLIFFLGQYLVLRISVRLQSVWNFTKLSGIALLGSGLLMLLGNSAISLFGVLSFSSTSFLIINRVFSNLLLRIIGFVASSYLIFQIFLYKIDFLIDEGFLLLLIFVFGVFSLIVFTYLSLLLNNSRDKQSKKLSPLLLIMVLFLLNLSLFLYGYWSDLGVLGAEITANGISTDVIFNEITPGVTRDKLEVQEKDISESVTRYLGNNIDEERIDVYALDYLLQDNADSLGKFRDGLLEKIDNDTYLGAEGSIKAWQFDLSSDAYFYYRITQKNSDAFTPEDIELIESWFYAVNLRAYEPSLADYAYGFLFKKQSVGLYLNQDIGYGMISILNRILEDEYPEIVAKNREVLRQESPGWVNNFKNADDGISYHQNVWIQNSFLIKEFEDIGSLDNAKLSTDWILYQSPFSAGAHPNYNSHNIDSALLSMIIGNHYFDSSEYQLLINNFLEEDITNDILSESLIGFDLIPMQLKMTIPTCGSVIITSPTGLNSHVSPLKPDKFVIRELIDGNEVLMIFNLRSSGWHKYHSSGELIAILVNGKIIAGQEIDTGLTHNWLPKGKSSHRDLKIQPEELILPLSESSGLERLFYYAFPLDKNMFFRDNDKFLEGSIDYKEGSYTIQLSDEESIEIRFDDDTVKVLYDYQDFKTNLEYDLL